jgi:hypothetical protein
MAFVGGQRRARSPALRPLPARGTFPLRRRSSNSHPLIFKPGNPKTVAYARYLNANGMVVPQGRRAGLALRRLVAVPTSASAEPGKLDENLDSLEEPEPRRRWNATTPSGAPAHARSRVMRKVTTLHFRVIPNFQPLTLMWNWPFDCPFQSRLLPHKRSTRDDGSRRLL